MKNHNDLLNLLEAIDDSSSDISLVSVSTTDGFQVEMVSSKKNTTEPDKIAAMASSLFALCDSVTESVFLKKSDISTMETSVGNLLLLGVMYKNTECVLTLATKSTSSLAQGRFIAKRLMEEIEKLSDR